MQGDRATGEGRALLQAAGLGTKDREPIRKGAVIGQNADVGAVAAKFIPTRCLQVFEAIRKASFPPYPSFQVLRRSLLKDASDALPESSYCNHFRPDTLRAVGMAHDMP